MKGFTLIELLAVIVILAIIALIATPIVLGIINDSKESAILRSAEFYVDAVKNGIMKKNLELNGTLNPEECEVIDKYTVKCDEIEIDIEVDGEVPDSGTITFDRGLVTNITLTFGENTVSMDSNGQLVLGDTIKVCKITKDEDSDGVADIGDMITCSTESFYVISNDGTTISMLAEFNLDVGNIYDVDTGDVTAITNSTGIQNKDAKGYVDSSSIWYGVLPFSTIDYWYDSSSSAYIIDANYASEGREYPFVYGDYKDSDGNQQNEIYSYVKAYEEYLIGENIMSAEATLISYEQLINLGCIVSEYSCASSSYPWTYSTSYWTGSANDNYYVWIVFSSGLLDHDIYDGDYNLDGKDRCGVRPAVNISVNEL